MEFLDVEPRLKSAGIERREMGRWGSGAQSGFWVPTVRPNAVDL